MNKETFNIHQFKHYILPKKVFDRIKNQLKIDSAIIYSIILTKALFQHDDTNKDALSLTSGPQELTEISGIPVRSVIRYCDELIKAGLLRVEHKGKKCIYIPLIVTSTSSEAIQLSPDASRTDVSPYYQIPSFLWNQDKSNRFRLQNRSSAFAFMILYDIYKISIKNNNSELIHPSLETIANKIGVERKTVKKYIDDLENNNIIKCIPQGKKCAGNANSYIIPEIFNITEETKVPIMDANNAQKNNNQCNNDLNLVPKILTNNISDNILNNINNKDHHNFYNNKTYSNKTHNNKSKSVNNKFKFDSERPYNQSFYDDIDALLQG